MRRDTGLTYDLLHGISTKLSGRHDCKHMEYHVTIFDGHVYMVPIIYVYPDSHHRRRYDKCNVVDHILSNIHAKFMFDDKDLVDGVYVYKWNSLTNRRMWINKYM